MITAASLNAQKSKELAQLAKTNGVTGWHSMKKSDLIKALLKIARNEQRRSTTKAIGRTTAVKVNKAKATKPPSESAIAMKLRREREQHENRKNLALASQVGNRHSVAPDAGSIGRNRKRFVLVTGLLGNHQGQR